MSRPSVDPKRTGVKALRTVFSLEDGCYPDYAEPGVYELADGLMLLACPGCGHVSGMRVGNPKPTQSPSWQLTGDPNAPTCQPSINCVGCCKWHGWLKAGVFESC
jgi:hypothetical protein